jgi:hypothetical protein
MVLTQCLCLYRSLNKQQLCPIQINGLVLCKWGGRLLHGMQSPYVKLTVSPSKTLCYIRWQIIRHLLKTATHNDRTVKWTMPFKRTSKLGLVNSPEYERCKQACEMASHSLWLWRSVHIKIQTPFQLFMKSGDSKDICQQNTAICPQYEAV